MSLPPIQPVSQAEFYVNGDVIIDESAVVAPGVILNAAPDSQILIGAGVCVGMGTILNAYQGVIALRAGAILGAGVLVVGQGEIGENACIGATTTIFQASVAAMAVIPSGSLIGDTSRQVTRSEKGIEPETATPTINEIAVEPESSPAEPEPDIDKQAVVGQVYINQLLFTLFPDRRYYDGTKNNSS